MKAVKNNNFETVFNMLNKDESLVNLVDAVGRTPLHFAVWRGFALVVKILLYNKANIQVEDELGVTPYNLAENLDNDDVY